MNERIKQLAEQAGLEFDDDLTLESEPIYYVTQTDVYKFAELIVNECADWINDNVGMIDEEARQDLLKHFGVNDG